MYLSRLILNPRSREVRRDLGSHHDLHRTVLSLFPQLPAEARQAGMTDARQYFGVLHRLDTNPRIDQLTLLIQSRVEPDFSRLPAGYLSERPPAGIPSAECKPIGDRYDRIAPGMTLAFRLRANPTKRLAKDDPNGRLQAGKRVGLREEKEWWDWLRRKGELAGFRVLDVNTPSTGQNGHDAGPGGGTSDETDVPNVRATPSPRPAAPWGTRGARDGRRLTLDSVVFEGLLEVIDPAAFRGALEQGIGSGKAYGFGMLSVAPVAAAALGRSGSAA